MSRRNNLRYKLAVMILALVLIIPLLVACGSSEEENETLPPTATATAPIATTTPTATNTSPATPTASTEPVKIGAINPWSGPAGMAGNAYADPIIALVEKQVKDTGGILGGREVNIVRFDNRAAVAEAVAGVKKLALEEKVSILIWGGVSAAEFAAVGDAAEEVRVPYVGVSGFVGIDGKKFSVASSPPDSVLNSGIAAAVAALKPKTVAFLQAHETSRMEKANVESEMLKAEGVNTVYNDGVPLGTVDYMPFLTKIKQLNPAVLVLNLDSEQCISVTKQIMELGGWGGIQVVSFSQFLSAAKQPGAEGAIVMTTWNPGKDYPASQKFEQDFKAVNGRMPTANHVYYYLSPLTAVAAIKLADTDDPIKINDAIHSGNLQFDTPMGMAHFTPKGDSGLKYMYVKIQKDGTTVPFTW